MPTLTSVTEIPRPVDEVFAFFLTPSNRLLVAPPELHLQLVNEPERVEVGSRITWQGKRAGIPHRAVMEVTELVPGRRYVEEQVTGPFGHWVQRLTFEPTEHGTRLTEEIECEPPGGLLGMLMKAIDFEGDLRRGVEHRHRRLQELFP